MSAFPALQRFTTRYNEREDRIHLTGETLNAGVQQQVSVWLPQRILNRLVPVLTQWLEKQSSTELRSDLLQSMAQQAARAALDPQTPVQSSADTPSWLAHTVTITPLEHGMSLTFRGDLLQGGAAAGVTLFLQGRPLRQWLNIVYEQYRRAEWAVTPWPAWIREAQDSQSLPALEVILH